MKKVLLAVLVSLGIQTQAQQNWCDSLSYSILVDSSTWNTLSATGNADGVINMVDSIEWSWQACNANTCYSEAGDIVSFLSILPTDTVKLCYDAYIYYDSSIYICTQCDSVVYDFMTDTWVLMNTGNPSGIEELIMSEGMSHTIYDIYGRELLTAPIGQMYIQNKKKYLKLR